MPSESTPSYGPVESCGLGILLLVGNKLHLCRSTQGVKAPAINRWSEMTISDPDIWRAAQLMVKRHGADAPIVAAQRADELFEQGDLDGVAVWKRILYAVEELQRVTPNVGERVN